MIELIHESTPIARKEYSCNACDFLFEIDFWSELNLTFSDYREIVKARQHNYKILKGERYIRQFNKAEGHTYTFRAIPAIHRICVKLNLYEP